MKSIDYSYLIGKTVMVGTLVTTIVGINNVNRKISKKQNIVKSIFVNNYEEKQCLRFLFATLSKQSSFSTEGFFVFASNSYIDVFEIQGNQYTGYMNNGDDVISNLISTDSFEVLN
jgi:hypothetical protein